MPDFIDELSDSLDDFEQNGKRSPMLQFAEYSIDKKLGRGQQGIVVRAVNSNGKAFAIKLSCPRDKNPAIVQKTRERFQREAQILLQLSHHNIVGAYQVGSASWVDAEKKWTHSYDAARDVLFYVMEYVEGVPLTELFYARSDEDNGENVSSSKCTQATLWLFESLIRQMCDAISFFHTQSIVHRDIKARNIIYSTGDRVFKIVDFGFAKVGNGDSSGSSPREVIIKKKHQDFESEQADSVDALADQYSFAEMLSELLEQGFKHHYKPFNYEGIKACLDKARHVRADRFASMVEFAAAIRGCLCENNVCPGSFSIHRFLVPSSLFGYLDSSVRIPFSGSIPMAKEVWAIVDTAEFQRLRGVRQLGPSHFVYPGATHTRFEHSIGAYYLSLLYLEVLLKDSRFLQITEPVDEAIKLVVLGALLHDIGHYPYSHMTEEMHGLPDRIRVPRHEKAAKRIITRDPIKSLIENTWGVDPTKVSALIEGRHSAQREGLLQSIIDSAIDVDKVDYLQRDSAHCGVPYGQAFDVERFIGALTVNEDGNGLCLTEKGRSCFLAFLMGKIVMYQEVYWHKTLRACVAMYKRFVYELLSKMGTRGREKFNQCLMLSDDEFLKSLWQYAKKTSIANFVPLLEPLVNYGPSLYKAAYVHYHGHPKYMTRCAPTAAFFDRLAQYNTSYPKIVEMTSLLVEELQELVPGLSEPDLILETTPITSSEAPDVKKLAFYDPQLQKPQPIGDEVAGIVTHLDRNRRSFLFCKSDYRDRIRDLWRKGRLGDIFSAVLEKL